MRLIVVAILAATFVACGSSGDDAASVDATTTRSAEQTEVARSREEQQAAQQAVPAETATPVVTPTFTVEPTETPKPTHTPTPIRPTATIFPRRTPTPVATPTLIPSPTLVPTYTPVSAEVFGLYLLNYLGDALDASKTIGDSLAVPEADRGQFWERNLKSKAQELRDLYDLTVAPMTSLNSTPNDDYALLVSQFQAALKIHADTFDAYDASGDVQAYKDGYFAYLDAFNVVANDILDYQGL